MRSWPIKESYSEIRRNAEGVRDVKAASDLFISYTWSGVAFLGNCVLLMFHKKQLYFIHNWEFEAPHKSLHIEADIIQNYCTVIRYFLFN